MAPTVTRELRVVYGSTTVGGTSDTYQLTAGDSGGQKLTISRTYETTTVSFSVLVVADSDAAFQSACTALEDAFRQPRQRLRVQQGALFDQDLLDLNPATDSAIDLRAQISKSGAQEDTGRTRLYRVQVACGNPADQAEVFDGEAGLRDVRWNLTFTPARRGSLSISGTYTKLGANDAIAQYEAEIESRVSAITTALGGTWELTNEQQTSLNVEDSLMSFSRTYEEVILNQSVSSLDDSQIVRQSLSVNVKQEAPGDAPGRNALRLATVTVGYQAFVDKTATQDLTGKYEGTIRPWLIQHTQNVVGANAAALVSESKDFDGVENRITAGLTFLMALGGSVLRYSLTFEDRVETGRQVVPLWDRDPVRAYVYQGPRVVVRVVTQTIRLLGDVESGLVGSVPTQPFAGGGALPPIHQDGGDVQIDRGDPLPAPGDRLVLIDEKQSATPTRLGHNGYVLDVTDVVRASTYRLVNVVSGTDSVIEGGNGAGGTRTRAQPPGDV